VNFELSDEQGQLREAARGALGRLATVDAARNALEGAAPPDLWPTAVEAGWPGLVVSEERGGAGLGAFEAMLVMWECGRALAGVPLLGHVPATAILDSPPEAPELLAALAQGDRRAAFAPARPPSDLSDRWSAVPAAGRAWAQAPRAELDGERATLDGSVAWVPDLPGADVIVVVAVTSDGAPLAVAVEGSSAGVAIEPLMRYDASRPLGHLTLDGVVGTVVDAPQPRLGEAWYLAQGLLAAESLGASEVALETSLAYAKERFTFGRQIGSYQAVKHQLVELLRLLENGRSLMYYAGWAHESGPAEFPIAASAARVAASKALDFASRAMISIHGGTGATWEHDAPLYFRRSQLSKRLLGGAGDAADRVAGELLAAARAA